MKHIETVIFSLLIVWTLIVGLNALKDLQDGRIDTVVKQMVK